MVANHLTVACFDVSMKESQFGKEKKSAHSLRKYLARKKMGDEPQDNKTC